MKKTETSAQAAGSGSKAWVNEIWWRSIIDAMAGSTSVADSRGKIPELL